MAAVADPFEALPDELVTDILSFLPASSVPCVARTCKRFARLCDEPLVWRAACASEFPCTSRPMVDTRELRSEAMRWRRSLRLTHLYGAGMHDEGVLTTLPHGTRRAPAARLGARRGDEPRDDPRPAVVFTSADTFALAKPELLGFRIEASGAVVPTLARPVFGHYEPVTAMVALGAERVLSGGRDGRVVVASLTRRLLRGVPQLTVATPDWVRALEHNGTCALATSRGGTATFADLTTGAVVGRASLGTLGWTIARAPLAPELWHVGCADGTLRTLDTRVAAVECARVRVHDDIVSAVAVSADGVRVFTGSFDTTLAVSSLARPDRPVANLGSLGAEVTTLALLSERGQALAGASNGQLVALGLAREQMDYMFAAPSYREAPAAGAGDGDGNGLEHAVLASTLGARRFALAVAVVPEYGFALTNTGDTRVLTYDLATGDRTWELDVGAATHALAATGRAAVFAGGAASTVRNYHAAARTFLERGTVF